MEADKVTNYGKGFIELLPEIDKLRKQIMLPMLKVMYRKIGLTGIFKFIWKTGIETKIMKAHNWSDFEKKHGVKKETIFLLIKDFSTMKVLIDMAGEEKAMEIISETLKTGNEHTSRKYNKNLMLMPVEEFKLSNDIFACFKDYVKSIEKAVEQEGVHKFNIVADTKDTFAFNIEFCLMHEIAKELGNSKYCFISCHVDDIVFPHIGQAVKFQYMRSGSLGGGAAYCDFRFTRI